mgnify:CR=1 FL=1
MASEVKVKMMGLVPFDEIVDFIHNYLKNIVGGGWTKAEVIQKSEKPYRPLTHSDIVVNGTTLIERKMLIEFLYHNKKYRILYNYKNYIKFNIDEVFNNFKYGTTELNNFPQTELVMDAGDDILDIMPRIAFEFDGYLGNNDSWYEKVKEEDLLPKTPEDTYSLQIHGIFYSNLRHFSFDEAKNKVLEYVQSMKIFFYCDSYYEAALKSVEKLTPENNILQLKGPKGYHPLIKIIKDER